jgi:glyoxylase-like metal-dependent hydrolase (beta-lactamase superfamily II)
MAKRLLHHMGMTESMTDACVVHQLRADNCFAYLIADPDTREAALVDPRADRVMDYVRELEERGLRLRLVIETHTHADHLSGAAELRARTGADVALSGGRRPRSRRAGFAMGII